MMSGRVLSEEDKDRWIEAAIIKMERLEATIRDRDKTIAELSGIYEAQYGAAIQHLQKENERLHKVIDSVRKLCEAFTKSRK